MKHGAPVRKRMGRRRMRLLGRNDTEQVNDAAARAIADRERKQAAYAAYLAAQAAQQERKPT